MDRLEKIKLEIYHDEVGHTHWLITEIERLRKIEHDIYACADNPSKGAAAIAQNIRLGEEMERLAKKVERLEVIVKSDKMGQQIYNEWMKCDERIRQLEALKEK